MLVSEKRSVVQMLGILLVISQQATLSMIQITGFLESLILAQITQSRLPTKSPSLLRLQILLNYSVLILMGIC